MFFKKNVFYLLFQPQEGNAIIILCELNKKLLPSLNRGKDSALVPW